MESVIKMTYDEKTSQVYRNWTRSGNLKEKFLQGVYLDYFGDLNGAKVIDFGCGNGEFMKKCLDLGASYAMGLDASDSMLKIILIDSYGEERNRLQFAVKDCFQPINENYGQFDYASAQFLVPYCKNDDEVQNLFENIFNNLKPGGKALILKKSLPETLKEQQIINEISGCLIKLQSEANGHDPFFVKIPVHSQNSKGGIGDFLFSFNVNVWSNEKLMAFFRKTGFVNVRVLKTKLSDYMNLEDFDFLDDVSDAKVIEKHFVFIAAEKP